MKDLSAIEQILKETIGLDTVTTGRGAISRAVAAIMKRNGITDITALAGHLKVSDDDRQQLLEEIVVPETWFFRDTGPFDYLKSYVQEIWQPSGAGKPFRVLSAPCSTGEEPYSIVMTLLDAGLRPADFQVDAMDISARALSAAQRARYGRGSFRNVLPERQMRHFRENGQGVRLSDEIVQAVNFFQDNLLSSRKLGSCAPYHAIFCRNVLIYMHAVARQKVFTQLNQRLHPGGILFSGHTETVFWLQSGYIPVRQARTFALQKPAGTETTTKESNPPSGAVATNRKSQPPLCTLKGDEYRGNHVFRMPACTKTTPADSRNGASPPAASADRASLVPKEMHAQAPVPDSPPLDRRLQEARRLANEGLFDPAVSLCREYLQATVVDAEAHCLLGLILEASDCHSEAEDCFHKALYLDPDHYESLIHLGLLYQQRGDGKKAALYRERVQRSERRRLDAES
jgi:chemotaxis protein methyltransferase WspC